MKKWLKIALIVITSLIVLAIMSLTYDEQNSNLLNPAQIYIHVDQDESAFLTETELRERLERQNLVFPGQTFATLDIFKIEENIRQMNEVKNVKVFANIGQNWTIDVELRRPIARIFNKTGESFYLDSEGHTMQPSELHTARVVVVNGHIPDRLSSENVFEIINNDALISIRKLDDIYRITNYVCNDPFLHAQIAQIYLEKTGDFVLTPQVGGHKIVFGTANSTEDVSIKFEKLKTFYKEGLPFEGWNKYSEISLKYENQIVCKKKK